VKTGIQDGRMLYAPTVMRILQKMRDRLI